MCGIAGAIMPNSTPEERLRVARNLLIESQTRGTDATGIGFHLDDGTPQVLKHGTKAAEFVKAPVFNGLELPSTFILHTRRTTKGSEKDNKNNHPLVSAATGAILVHNGVVDDDNWRAVNEDGGNPYMYESFRAEVDTEAILNLIVTMRMIPRNDDLSVTPEVVAATPKEDWRPQVSWMRAIDDATCNLEGSGFACALLVPDEPNTLHLFRHNNPLFVAYIPEWDAVVFSSEEKILAKAISHTRVEHLFGIFPKTEYIVPEYAGLEMEECGLWKITYEGEGHYDIHRGDIDPPFFTRRGIASSSKQGVTQVPTGTGTTVGFPDRGGWES